MTNSISFLSYNTHLFVDSIAATFKPALVYQDEVRKKDIVNKINDANGPSFDVVGLTEVWAHKTQDYFKNNLTEFDSFAYQGESILSGSAGMFLGVRGNLQTPPMAFQRYENMVEDDKLSCKGVTYGRVTLKNNKQIYLIQTHAQASYTNSEAKDEKARQSQMQATLFPIIEDALRNFKSGPIFLLGDLNIIAGSEEYNHFAKQLSSYGMSHGRNIADAWPLFSQDQGITYDPQNNSLVQHFDSTQNQKQRLDYIFFTPDQAKITNIEVPHWQTNNVDDSDHYPVVATFELI